MLLLVDCSSHFPPRRRCANLLMKISRAQSPRMMIAFIFWTVLLIFNTSSTNAQEWPYRIVDNAKEIQPCEGLGFPNATKNNCGYCTQGNTGLAFNYSMDCAGSCSAGQVIDCAGMCGGSAYIDECSGQCIGGTTGKRESDVESYRDCRGYCASSGGQFYLDDCGVCHTGASPFQDCTNTCYLPGREYMMAKLICGRCVGSNTGVSEIDVLDECGNCRSDTVECPCNGTGVKDVCGVCKGGGKSCLRAISARPTAIPANKNANIIVEGAFRGRSKNLKCILQRMTDSTVGNTTEFAASGNGTRVNCPVRLKPGTYRIGVKLVGEPPESIFVEEFELLVYEDVYYNSMSPMKAVFDREGSSELVVTFSGGRVPNLPLICIISGEGWPADQKLSRSESNMLDTCVIPYPQTSMKLSIAPSFNGIHPFKQSFTLKFYASPPEIRDSYIAEDGHAAVIIFDRPVSLCDLNTCSDILEAETMSQLGEGATCQWATKQQLIITVLNPIPKNSLKVTFERGVLKQDGQRYTLPKNESRTVDVYYPRPVSNAQLAISGPYTISYCGVFTLVGHFSSPKGDAEYYWTVYRADQHSVEQTIADALLAIRTTSLSLDAALLEVDMNYTFVLTAEHPVNEKYEARHEVCRKSQIGPLVTAYSDVMTQPSVTVDQRITLYAELTLPDCISRMENMHLMWAVNNPKVKFNFDARHMQVYEIQPYSLPENSEIVFTAFAYFSNLLNVTSSRVVLRVEQFKLKATIRGTPKRYAGNKDGNLTLESEVESLGFPIIYQWKCYDQSGSVCYNYKKDSTQPLLLPRKMQSQPKLVIPCDSLKAGQVLTFQLQVFNVNNRYQYSQPVSTDVYVEDRNIPQVVIDSVLADGKHHIERHPLNGAYSIPAGLSVTVYATVTPVKAPLKSVKWEVKGFSSSFTYTTVNGKSVLTLEEGFLVGHGIYLVGLSACDGKGSCGIANLTIHAVPGIALCKLENERFVEYAMVKAVVKGCSIPLGRQPVTYQIYLHTSESVFPITAPQTPTMFDIIGPPYQSRNGTRMSVEVCDKYLICKMFPGPRVKVTRSENAEEDREKVLEKAKKAMELNDPLTALSLYLTVASNSDVPMSTSEVNDMMKAGAKVTDAKEDRYLSAGQLSLIYSAMLPLVKHENNKIKRKALAVIKRGTNLIFAHKVKVPTSILAQGHSNAAAALTAKNTDLSVIQKVQEVLDFFVEKVSTTAPLGSRIQLSSDSPGYPSSLVFRQLLDRTPIFIKTITENGMVEGSVRFEEAVREKVRNRPCEKGSDCEGIIVALTLYPDKNPYPSSYKRTSPVMDVVLRNPEDGKPFRVADVPNAVRLALTHKGNYTDAEKRGILFKCSYWDAELKDWAQDGLVTYGAEGSLMRCWSSHLTSFAVIETSDGLSAGSIVGIVVTVLMGVFIIMMLAFFFFRKKHAAKSRVSHEALQPKRMNNNQSEKLQGLNGSVVRVKTVTP